MTQPTSPATVVPVDRSRPARSALPSRVRSKLERLERAAVAARAVVLDVGARLEIERTRLRALTREAESWSPGRVPQQDAARHDAQVAATTAEVKRLETERDVLQERAQTLGAVVDAARAHLGMTE